MVSALILAYIEQVRFAGRLLYAIPVTSLRYSILRLLCFPLLWCASLVLLLVHTLGFLVDELLFFSYRKIRIHKPIFIIGIPRSGTTWLQRVLANDDRLTSLTLAEALFMPSISERYFWRGIGYLLAPLGWLFRRVPFHPLGKMDAVHKIRFSEPEEDFLLLLPLQACFLVVLLCPRSAHYWKLADFDLQFSVRKREIILNFYQRCLQKHLYVHGATRTVLSKNPSFTPFVDSLRQRFDDANIIACVRPPAEVVPSQINSLEPTGQLIGYGVPREVFHGRMLALLKNYYQIVCSRRSDLILVEMEELANDLENVVKKLYFSADMVMTPEFEDRIKVLGEQGRRYKSGHQYSLAKFKLSREEIEAEFAHCWPIPS